MRNLNPEYSDWLLDELEANRLKSGLNPQYLGGVNGPNGGVGLPPGGFIGRLVQRAVTYDTTEGVETTGSAPSLLLNLNRIRARLSGVFPMYNRSGGALVEGDVVVLDLANPGAVTTTNIAGDQSVTAVARESVSSGSLGYFSFDGYVRKVNLDFTAAIGDYFYTSATPKQAAHSTSGSEATVFGICMGTGSTPAAILFNVNKRASGGGGGGGATLASVLETRQATITNKAAIPAGLLSRQPSTTSGSAVDLGWMNTVDAAATDSTTAGVKAWNSGSQSTAIGYGAMARVSQTINLGGPIIVRRDIGEDPLDNFRNFAGVEVILTTDVIDLTSIADYSMAFPGGARFWWDEMGIILTRAGGVTSQPEVRFGYGTSLAAQLSPTTTTLLISRHRRQTYTPASPQISSTDLSFGVTTGAVAAHMEGRVYWKGVLIETEIDSSFEPTDVPGLMVWYDWSDVSTLFQDDALTVPVTADNDPIGGVQDKSGNGYPATQPTSGDRPLYKTGIQNGLSIGRFDGSDDHMFLTPANGTTGLTAFLVLKPPSSGSSYLMDGKNANNDPAVIYGFSGTKLEYYASGGSDRQTFADPPATWSIIAFSGDGTSLEGYYNGSQVFVKPSPSLDLTGQNIGLLAAAVVGSPTAFAATDFAEMLIYDGKPTSLEIDGLFAYLNNKWGVY